MLPGVRGEGSNILSIRFRLSTFAVRVTTGPDSSAKISHMEAAIESTPTMGEPERQKARQLTLAELRPPRAIPGYEQERFLGRGAFGEVWVAIDSNNGRKVAIKYYHRRGGLDWSLLSREVEKLRYLFGDRHVVQLLQVGWESDPPYYVMEYMENGSLEDLLREASLPFERALSLFKEIATGLIHAHGKGILHCDLKPANVMLDQDGQPRLADFGQSRLSHEHSPALGTLFYMAPEQADLKASPDVRWDVYALGAVVYRMFVGEPPYRNPEAVAAIQLPGTLEERLARYRQILAAAPKPTAHRSVSGVDALLAAIIEKCLAVNPRDRYPNVQAVLSALDARAAARARKPLLLLGGVGPLLVMLVVLLVAGVMFRKTMGIAQDEVTARAVEGNRFAARAEADRLGREVRTRWLVLEREARAMSLSRLLADPKPFGGPDDERVEKLNTWIRDKHKTWDPILPASIWFINDRFGYQRAASEPVPNKPGEFQMATTNLGKYFGFRDYFHGHWDEFPSAQPPADPALGPKPLTRPHRSRVYRRQNEKSPTYVVTYSVPVFDRERPDTPPVGVLTMSSELVGSTQLRNESGKSRDRVVMLIDTRPDEAGRRGVIVRHPYQEAFRNNPRELPIHTAENLAAFRDGYAANYTDPIGGEYERAQGWLAVAEPVTVPDVANDVQDTGWLMLVEEDQAKVVQPIRELRSTLGWYGVLAVVLVAVVLTLVWGFVMVVLNAAPASRVVRFLRRQVGLKSGLSGGSSASSGSASSVSGISGSGGIKSGLPPTPNLPLKARE
ncbi:MAG: hypothetical protein C0467_11470 [Planctomycetaceae bacterium]|nr:hypothetical protein [Planctomycetaceae bacterium]